MKEIIFKNVTKSYDSKNLVLEDLNLEVNPGERLILLGPSGCGKSTTLRIIAGLESISSGQLIMNDRVVNNIPAGERNLAMVFQNYALYPHMSVAENIAYGLKINKVPKEEILKRSKEVLEILKLSGLENRKPKELSGGQRQRVALARAIVKNSDYLLLDEPLSNLDAQLRLHSRQELVRLHERFQMTMVYVTHDQVEAMTVGQKIVILNKGKIQMVGTPNEIYNRPTNVFTAKFIGSPPMNVMPAYYENGSLKIKNLNQNYIIEPRLKTIIERNENPEILIGIRPEKIKILDEKTESTINVIVDYVEDYGNRVSIYFNISGEDYNVVADKTKLKAGEVAHLLIPNKEIVLFDANNELNIMGEDY